MNSLDNYKFHYSNLSDRTQRELKSLYLVPVSLETLEYLLKSAGASYAKLCDHGFGVGFCVDKQCQNYADSTKVL